MTQHRPGWLFHRIGRFLKSAAAPMPSPELAELREATAMMRDAAGHLTEAADKMRADVSEIGRVARQLSKGTRERRSPAKKRPAKL